MVRLNKENQTQEDIRMLQTARNFKIYRDAYNLESDEIYEVIYMHEKEENYTRFDDINVYNFAYKRLERWNKIKERSRRVDELKDYTDVEKKNLEEKLKEDQINQFYECLNVLAKYNLENRAYHKKYTERVRDILCDIEEKVEGMMHKNKQIISELLSIENEVKNQK